MAFKFIGGAGLAIGVLLLLLALAQPATVPDSATTCVDSSYYGQDCATVSYERPNYGRSSLFGGAVFLIFSGLITYAIGAARSPSEGGSSPDSMRPSGSETAGVDHVDTGPRTLREQLEARKAERETTDASTVDGRGAEESPTRDPTSATPGADAPEASQTGRDSAGDIASTETEPLDDGSRFPLVVPVTASALTSAFVLSSLLGAVTTVESLGLRALVFVVLSLPGMLLYWSYASRRADSDTDLSEVAD